MAKAQQLVAQALNVKATARLKTVNTLVEKLCRLRTRLSKMQDIAGLRIVEDWHLAEQDAAVETLLKAFPVAQVDDLRSSSRYGYRAVHVVADVDGYSVEIQVRTRLQDAWAQCMESLADRVGRGIRYGEPPDITNIGAASVDRILRLMQSVAEDVRELESKRAEFLEKETELLEIEREWDREWARTNPVTKWLLRRKNLQARMERMKQFHKASQAEMARRSETVREQLQRLRDVLT